MIELFFGIHEKVTPFTTYVLSALDQIDANQAFEKPKSGFPAQLDRYPLPIFTKLAKYKDETFKVFILYYAVSIMYCFFIQFHQNFGFGFIFVIWLRFTQTQHHSLVTLLAFQLLFKLFLKRTARFFISTTIIVSVPHLRLMHSSIYDRFYHLVVLCSMYPNFLQKWL